MPKQPTRAELQEALDQHAGTIELLQERLAELELAIEDVGWERLTGEGDHEFSRDALRRLCRRARLMYLANPLIRHAVEVQAHYVFGQGVTLKAESASVNEVLQAWWDDPRNQAELTSPDALLQRERDLRIEGNLFFVLFTNPSTGRVTVRTIPVDEVEEIVTNPEDLREPWYYRRVWMERRFDQASGLTTPHQRTTYYPDWRYQPRERPQSIGGHPVAWDAPVYHVKVGGTGRMRFGVPEVYPALDWARAVKEDLEDFATIRRALARFAWSLTTPGGKKAVAAAKAKLGTTFGSEAGAGVERNPAPLVGSTFIGGEGVKLEPVRTAGSAPHPEEGRRLWLMVGAGVGLPETILSGNADVGNLATAKTLDRPTELQMEARRRLWTSVLTNLAQYQIDQAATKPNGLLFSGARLEADEDGATRVVLPPDPETGEPLSRRIDVDWPPILERDVKARIDAIVAAATQNGQPDAGTMTAETKARLLLSALGVETIDEELERLREEGMSPAAEARLVQVLAGLEEAVRGGAR